MKSYHKRFRMRMSMEDGLELEGPVDERISCALAFFLRVTALGVLVWAIRWW